MLVGRPSRTGKNNMAIDDALVFIFKEKLKNIQLIEDFIDDPTLDTDASSRLNQKIENLKNSNLLIKRNEILMRLKERQRELYKFKKIIIEHIIQNESLEQLKNLEKNIKMLKEDVEKEQKAKQIYLELIHKKIRAKINSIKHKKKMSNIYMVGNGMFTIISASFGAAASYFPIFSFILLPLQQGFNFLSYLSWWRAIENDNTASEEEKEIIRLKLKSIKRDSAGSAIAGMIGGALLFISAVIPPIAPVTLALGIGTILISNILISVAGAKDLYREVKHGKRDAGRKARIASYSCNLISSISNTLGSTLLLTAAVLALAFPPSAMAVAGAFAIVGLVFIAINVASFISSKISLYVASKKSHLTEPGQESTKKTVVRKDLELREKQEELLNLSEKPDVSVIPETSKLVKSLEKSPSSYKAIKSPFGLQEKLFKKDKFYSQIKNSLWKTIANEKLAIEKKYNQLKRLREAEILCKNEITSIEKDLAEFTKNQEIPQNIKEAREDLKQKHSRLKRKIVQLKRLIKLQKKSLHIKESRLVDKKKLHLSLKKTRTDTQAKPYIRKKHTGLSSLSQSLTYAYETNQRDSASTKSTLSHIKSHKKHPIHARVDKKK